MPKVFVQFNKRYGHAISAYRWGRITLSLLGGMTALMMYVVVLATASSADRSGEQAVFFVAGEDDFLGDTPRLLLAMPFIVIFAAA